MTLSKQCYCGKMLNKGTISDICLLCRKQFLMSINRNLNLVVKIIK